MAKKEVNTDLWVHELLKEAGIRENFDAQGSNVKEINEALKTASKKGTGNSGFPEYVGIVKDFLIIIEDKPGLSKHINYTDDDLIADELPFFGLSWDTEITYVNKRVKHFNVEDFTKGYLLIEKLELIKDVPEKE